MIHIPCARILKLRNVFLLSVEMAFLAGCATGVDRAVFVTKTSVSILDVDSTPPGVSIAYDRVEGFIGPAFESGGAPPAIAIIRSDGTVFAPKMRQLYATGNAARVVAGVDTNPNEDKLVGCPKLMLFGTSTNIGLKVGIDATTGGFSIPNNFVFGYRRKEFSMLPLGTTKDAGTQNDIHTYPSVLASIDNTVDTKNDSTDKSSSGGMTTVQYFATGVAATKLATTHRWAFITEGESVFGKIQWDDLASSSIKYAADHGTTAELLEVANSDFDKLDAAKLKKATGLEKKNYSREMHVAIRKKLEWKND